MDRAMNGGNAAEGDTVALASDDLTDDAFLGGSVSILQPRRGYRAGVDAVLLAASVPLSAGDGGRVLDVGAGVGTVGLSLARRATSARVVLLEKDPALADLARRNSIRNGLSDRVGVVEADVLAPAAALAGLGVGAETFDHVLANPPFHQEGRGTAAADPTKARAHAMAEGGLDAWLRTIARVTAPGGTATLVHKAEALEQLLAAMDGRLGAIKVLPIHPRAGAVAHRVIVRGTKGSRAPLTLLAGLILHGEGSAFTPAAEAVLRHGQALDLDAAM